MTNNKDQVDQKEGLILVGFGKHKLEDMLKWQNTEQEEDLATAFRKWPPVYRREGICSRDEIMSSMQYLAYLQDVILEYELNRPPEEESKND